MRYPVVGSPDIAGGIDLNIGQSLEPVEIDCWFDIHLMAYFLLLLCGNAN